MKQNLNSKPGDVWDEKQGWISPQNQASPPAVVSSRLPTGRKLRSLARKYAKDKYGAENINKDVPQYQIVQFEKIIEWLIKEGY